MRKVLFWDFDGTLVVSNPMWPEAMLRIIQSETGRTDLTFHDIRPHTRIGFTWHTPDDDHTGYKGQLWWERMFVRFAEVLKLFGVPEDRALPAARRMQEEILRISNYEIYPDTKEVLQYAIDRGWENYILSNNYPDMDLTMDAL
ncbi:MAG: HAD family hydrolase, partial [Firmicutes bacterium]|nr:HAD family hydrolase [Bacillota bacterium]